MEMELESNSSKRLEVPFDATDDIIGVWLLQSVTLTPKNKSNSDV